MVQQHPSAAVFPNGEAMAAMSARAVAAVRRWDAKMTAEHGPEALWLACSHGDVIKAIVADALGLHLDQFQRIVADPASVSVIRYTPTRPFVVRVNDTADLASLVPPKPNARTRARPLVRRRRRRRGGRRRRDHRRDRRVTAGGGVAPSANPAACGERSRAAGG